MHNESKKHLEKVRKIYMEKVKKKQFDCKKDSLSIKFML